MDQGNDEKVHDGMSSGPTQPGFMPTPPGPPMDPAHGFMWGAQNLFAGLHAVNMRLERLEQQGFAQSDHEEAFRRVSHELNSLRTFVLSVHRQLLAHDDFIRNPKFLQGVDQRSYETVVSKCLPEIWQLRTHVDQLAEQVSQLLLHQTNNNNNLEEQQQQQQQHGQSLNSPVASKNGGLSQLAEDVENVLLRLAAFGDERIYHVEIIGDSGRRYKNGAPRRTIVHEKDMMAGVAHANNLPVPKSWKSDSDSRTINKNFQQMTKMINEIVLRRMDDIETRVDARLDRLDKRVDILNTLFVKLREDQETQDNRLSALESSISPKEENEVPKTEPQPAMTRSPQPHDKEESKPKSKSTSTVSSVYSPSETVNKTISRTSVIEKTLVTEQAALSPPSEPPHLSSENARALTDIPKVSHQSGAKAGRAAFERAKKSKQ